MSLKPIFLQPRRTLALGATLGQDLMLRVRAELIFAEQEDCALVLDAEKTTAINASFLKATLFWAFRCGQAEARKEHSSSSEPWTVRPLRLFPMILNCSVEVREEVDEFFRGRNCPLLHVDKDGHTTVLGLLDPALHRTRDLLCSVGEATAANLAARGQEPISVNGWNNRLADLHLLRLAVRRREGKFWVYSPAENEAMVWA
jgi:hypothetical protein